MPVDLFQSRRTYYDFCKWWSRDESDTIEPNELVAQRTPSGVFYAKEADLLSNSDHVVDGVYMFNQESLSIKTPDDVMGIKPNDIIEYQGDIWIVSNVQRVRGKKQNSMFLDKESRSFYWILRIRK